jgi:hypothetical protein
MQLLMVLKKVLLTVDANVGPVDNPLNHPLVFVLINVCAETPWCVHLLVHYRQLQTAECAYIT